MLQVGKTIQQQTQNHLAQETVAPGEENLVGSKCLPNVRQQGTLAITGSDEAAGLEIPRLWPGSESGSWNCPRWRTLRDLV